MNGLVTAKEIQKEWGEARPKLVAVSASAMIQDERKYFDAGFDDFISKPIDAKQIYECLANLLQIAYDYDDDLLSIDLSKIVLPGDLFKRLKKEAEMGDVMALEKSIEEIRCIGEHGRLLARQMHQLIRETDMETILALLGEMEDG